MPNSNKKKCDKDDFNKTSCVYITLVDKMYRCADVKNNFTYYEKKHLKPVKQCDDVCPASGSGWSSLTLTKIVLNHSFYNREMLRYNKTERKNTLLKLGAFGLSVVKPKPKLSTKASQKTGEIPFRANKIQSKNEQTS